jgi:hypothetical protein
MATLPGDSGNEVIAVGHGTDGNNDGNGATASVMMGDMSSQFRSSESYPLPVNDVLIHSRCLAGYPTECQESGKVL